jgi:uncharacterized tellurite resistance protein B-like protein
MELNKTFLQGHSDIEKGAYLGAIASIATADRTASEEEMQYLSDLCDAAGLSEQQSQVVAQAATELKGTELTRCLDTLKNSDLKYSLVTDLMAFARADKDYNEEEQETISEMAEYLGVNQHQFSLLNQFTEKVATTPAPVAQEQAEPSSFLSSLGLKDKLENAGINGTSLLKGLAAIAAPMILSRMMSGRSGSRNTGLGGALVGGGGLASIIGMLSGGRGIGNSGGLLGRVLGRGGF